MQKTREKNQYIVNAFLLAWYDTLVRYKKSIIGPFWYTLTNFFGIIVFSMVWAGLVHEPLDIFVPKLTVGLVLWQMISGVLTESPRMLTDNVSLLRNIRIPIWFMTARLISRQLINLGHNLMLLIGVFLFYGVNPRVNIFYSIIGLFFVVLELSLITYLLSGLGARFRDIRFAMETFVPFLFFISPIIFKTSSVANEYMWYNPISYMIEIVREPLIGDLPEGFVYEGFFQIFFVTLLVVWFFKIIVKNKQIYWIN